MLAHAVVIGTDHINTLGIVRSLGEASVKVDLVLLCENSVQKSWVSKSRYVSCFRTCKACESDIVSTLVSMANHQTEKNYLFTCNDYAALVTDKYRNQLSNYYYVPGIENGALPLEKLMEKSTMIAKASESGFKIPKTMLCSFSSINEKDYKNICSYFSNCYPLFIRPSKASCHFGDYLTLENEDQLTAVLSQYRQGEAIIQEYIIKDEEIGIQGVGFGSSGVEPVITGTIHKKRTSVISHGSTTYAKITPTDASEPISECKKYIKETGYSGIFDIELLRKGKSYYFIECNFRNGTYGYAYTCFGHNLPLTWINKSDKNNITVTKSCCLMNEFADIKHIKAKNVHALMWLKQFLQADVHLTLNRGDLRPAVYRLLSVFERQ